MQRRNYFESIVSRIIDRIANIHTADDLFRIHSQSEKNEMHSSYSAFAHDNVAHA